MMRIDATIDGKEFGFLTNNNGDYFFELINGSTKQLSCDSGFNSLKKIKKAVRDHLKFKLGYDMLKLEEGKKMPSLKYELRKFDEWK